MANRGIAIVEAGDDGDVHVVHICDAWEQAVIMCVIKAGIKHIHSILENNRLVDEGNAIVGTAEEVVEMMEVKPS